MAVTKFTTTQAGSTTQYTVTFEVIDAADIDVYVNGVLQLQQNTTSTAAADHPQVVSGEITQGTNLINYTVASNNGTITFNQAPTNGAFLIIERTTDDTLLETFVSGSTIRAQDLNNAFERVLFVAQEGVGIADEALGPAEDEDNAYDALGNRISNVADATDDDDVVNRAQLGKVITDDLIEGEGIDLTDVTGGSNSNKQVTISAEFSTDTNPGIITVDATTPITRTYGANGQLDLSIEDNTIDLDKIKNSDIINQAEQDASSVTPADGNIFTALAAARRFDTLVQTGTPTGSTWETGKTWYQNDEDKTVYVWDGDSWEAITSGGAFTRLDQVIYVDASNGNDANNGHRISTPKRTIASALAAINEDSSYGNGSTILVAPGVYQETAPLDIEKTDVSIIGASVRNTIIHPTEETETNSLFRVNSGSYLANMTFTGVKASGTRGDDGSLWTDSEYGLPPTQGWNVSFYPDAKIFKSPYIQNCTNFSDSEIDNDALDFYTGDSDRGQAGDLDSEPTGGGLLVDGSTVHDDSPLRSMVADSYTHVALDGPGIFVTNNGYAQITSSYSFFNHFHIGCLNGGQANLAASTSDFGRFSLVASGRSTSAIFSATTTVQAASGATTFTIGEPTAGSDWFGNATRPADNMLVQVNNNFYPILSAVPNGSGWDVTISRPDTGDRTQNLGLNGTVASGSTALFYLRSMIASSGHTMEYVGAGTDYRALPYNATGTYTVGSGTQPNGVPIEAHQVKELNNGKVWAAITDHNGKFRVGDTFSVNQQTGFVDIPAGALSVSKLLANLDTNNKTIVNNSGNVTIDDTLSMNSNKIINVTDPTSAQDAATKAYVDALESDLEGGQLDNLYFRQDTGETIESGDTWSSSDASIATTAAIDARIIDLVDDVGGFVPIANETSFPATNPDINDPATGGTIVSIKEITTSRTPSSGTVTIANGSGSNTVTINGCGTTVLAAGFGVLVETTSTLHTYNFHRLTPKATEVTTVATNVSDVNTVADDISNVNTVAGDISNVNTTAGSISNVNTVAGSISNVNTAAGSIANINTVANDLNEATSEIDTVATNIANVNTVGNSITNVNTVATNINSVNDFADKYRIGATDPTTDNDDGDLFYNTTSDTLKIWDGSAWQTGVTDTAGFVTTSGATMTGQLNTITPTSGSNATNKTYVDGTIDSKIDTALTSDVVGGTGITVSDNTPGSGQITIDVTAGSIGPTQLASTAVAAGSYGSSSAIPTFTVDADGRLTAAGESSIDSTSISNGTSNVSVAASGDITITRSGTVVGAFSSGGLDVPGGITANKIVVDDDGASSPTMVVKTDDNATTGFVVKNDTYSTNEEIGFKINQGNDGTVQVMNVGNSEYKGINFQTLNGSGGVKNAIIVNPEASVDLYYNNGVKLQTQSGGINVIGTVTCDGLTSDGNVEIRTGLGGLIVKENVNTGSNADPFIKGQDSGSADLWYFGTDTTPALYVWNYQNGSMQFATNNTLRAQFTSDGHFVPGADNTYDLGSVGAEWRNGYFDGTVNCDGLSVEGTGTFTSNITTNGSLTVGNGQSSSYINMYDSDNGTRYIHCNSNYIGFLTQGGAWGPRADDGGHWLPGANNTQDLGSSSFRWRNVYAGTLYGNGSNLTNIPAPAALSGVDGSAPSYSARAWVNWNGTGTVSIRDDDNVSSITDHGTGIYTVNFTTAMPHANYAAVFTGNGTALNNSGRMISAPADTAPSTGSIRCVCLNFAGGNTDLLYGMMTVVC
jgi:hypothetical protein